MAEERVSKRDFKLGAAERHGRYVRIVLITESEGTRYLVSRHSEHPFGARRVICEGIRAARQEASRLRKEVPRRGKHEPAV